jgi:hypothetical protein
VCHGAAPDTDVSKIWNASGTSGDQGVPGAIRRGINAGSGGMGMYSAVSDADLADMAAYVNAVRYGKSLTDGSGAVAVRPFILRQDGKVVTDTVLLPTITFGSAPTIKTTLSLQAPATGSLHIETMSINDGKFTLSRVPVAAVDRLQMATSSAPTSTTPTAVLTVQGTDQPCPATAFDLQANAACGVEVTMAVNNPGTVTATLQITTDPAKQTDVELKATVDAVASGGAGGGGCTMRSTPGLFDPMLLLLSVLSFGVLGLRRAKKNKL